MSLTRIPLFPTAIAVAVFGLLSVGTQGQAPPSAPRPAPTFRELAPIDITGYWVSVVTEDWRYRMVMPLTGDFGSVPLNGDGRKMAASWKPEQAGGCAAFGVGSGMRAPGRLHITWENDSTLRIDTEAGAQTRRLYLGAPPASGAPTWQGVSAATWDGPPDVIDVLRTGGFDQLNRGTGQAARRPGVDAAQGRDHQLPRRLAPSQRCAGTAIGPPSPSTSCATPFPTAASGSPCGRSSTIPCISCSLSWSAPISNRKPPGASKWSPKAVP
jgi:hypothetical protein